MDEIISSNDGTYEDLPRCGTLLVIDPSYLTNENKDDCIFVLVSVQSGERRARSHSDISSSSSLYNIRLLLLERLAAVVINSSSDEEAVRSMDGDSGAINSMSESCS